MYPATVADWRLLAQRRLPRFLFDYVAGGAGDEVTLAANVADFAAIRHPPSACASACWSMCHR